MPTGTIKKITDKGFGFIAVEGGKDMFFHMNDCKTPFDSLQEGQTVSFEEQAADKGPRAVNVEVTA